jgi:hypothetical protein
MIYRSFDNEVFYNCIPSPLYEEDTNWSRMTFGEVEQLLDGTIKTEGKIQENRNVERDSSLLVDNIESPMPDDSFDSQNENWDENKNVSETRTALPYVQLAFPIATMTDISAVTMAAQTNLTTIASRPVKPESMNSSGEITRFSNGKARGKRSRSSSNSDEKPPAKVVKRTELHAPSSRNKEDVLSYMVEKSNLNFVVALTKIKPKKGKASHNGQYWEIEDIAESCNNETIIMRTGNKGINHNGSSNRILYAFYCRFPIDITDPKPENVSLRLRENETGKYEDKDKVKVDEIKIYQCEDVSQFFAYVKARIDLSQDCSKSRIHNIELFYENKLIQKSKKCKFVSGKSELAILSNQSPSQSMNWKKHHIQEFKGSN